MALDVFVLPCGGVHLQGAIRVVAVMAGFQAVLMRGNVGVAPAGRLLDHESRRRRTGRVFLNATAEPDVEGRAFEIRQLDGCVAGDVAG